MANFELGEEIEKDAFCPSQARDKEKIQSPLRCHKDHVDGEKAITKLTYDTRPPESLLGIVSLSHTHDKTESIFRLVGYKFEMSYIHRFSVTTRFSYIWPTFKTRWVSFLDKRR